VENTPLALMPDNGREGNTDPQGTGPDPPNFRAPPPIPPMRRTIVIVAGAGAGTVIDPYSAQLNMVQDSGSNQAVPAAPVFLTTFMPIPSPMGLDHFESILPLDLSRN
jgi:hypothetical protein